MTEPHHFNDAPIASPDDDRFGIDPFAQALARSITGIKVPIGATIALNGEWGSGKSSAVNLIRHHLAGGVQSGELVIIDFKCWWFKGEEALTLAFLQELDGALRKTLGDKAKEIIPQLGRKLLQGGPVVGPAVNIATGGLLGGAAEGALDFAKRFFPEGENLEDLFAKLSDALRRQEMRFLVIIDDIDRLSAEEALLIFRLVKSVGRLPNVMYLLVFDRKHAKKIVEELHSSEDPEFLEKIIQASFELPLPAPTDLQNTALAQIEKLCGSPDGMDQLRRLMNIFYDAVAPYLRRPRDLTLLFNAMSVSWPPVADEVDVADYVALEAMRLFEPELYDAVRRNKDRICGVSPYGEGDPDTQIQELLELVPTDHHEQANRTLVRLFPRLQNVGYGQDFVRKWEAQRLVCSERHFDTYFCMTLGDDALSTNEISKFIERCGDPRHVKRAFRDALASIRRNGKSKVPLLFDELRAHASRIEAGSFKPLITAIFEIADDIYRDKDSEKGMLGFGDAFLQIHWLIRILLLERCDLEERTQILSTACKRSQLGWPMNFTNLCVRDYEPREGSDPTPPDECLVDQDCVGELKALALKSARNAAKKGQLIRHQELPYILFRWRDYAGDDGAAVKSWTNKQLEDDAAVARLSKAFTGETWSQSMGIGGLGDRVSTRNTQASVGGLETILDVGLFRRRLEELEANGTLDDAQRSDVAVFLEAWRKREAGDE